MIELVPKDRIHLRRLQKTNKDKRTYIKVTVLLMLDQGFTAAAIADALGIDDSSVYRYRDIFLEKGLDLFLSSLYRAYDGKLTEAEETVLRQELSTYLYINSQQVVDFIQRRFGQAYSCSGVVKLLHRLGFVYKKTKSVPAKADPEKQKQFVETLTELLGSLGEESVVYFNDAVHPLHNTRADYGWILQGEDYPIPSNAGRRRINLNGALNANDVTDILIREDDRINAQSTIALWESQRERHPDKTIYNVCDNARYYHSRLLKEWLAVNP